MAVPPDLHIDENPDERDVQFLGDQIYQFNVASTGIEDGRMLGIVLRDERGITAGLHGHTWGGVLEIGLLWVREDMRGRGYGSRLLVAAEEEAIRRGCTQAMLDTHSFQAPEFYLRHGYMIYGEMPDYPQGHSKVFLRKPLRPGRR